MTDPSLDAFDFGGQPSVVGGTQTFQIGSNGDDGSEETFPGECIGGFFPFMISQGSHFIHRCRFIGLRFSGITVPQGVTIENAFIDLIAGQTQTNSTTTTIVGQDVGNASPSHSLNTKTDHQDVWDMRPSPIS